MTGVDDDRLPLDLCRRWLPSLQRTQDVDGPALLCVPYAGGNAAAFRRWQARVGPAVRVLPLQFPGRWTRLREPPVESMGALVRAISKVITSVGLERYALYGHSFGALVAYEVAQLRVANGESLPSVLFVAAHPPPRHRPPPAAIHRRSDEDFLEALVLLDRPTAKVGSRHFARTIKSLKVDFRLSYDYEQSQDMPLPVPVTVVTGMSDPYVNRDLMVRWCEETTAGFNFLEVEGDHFFLHDPPATLLDAVRTALSRETG